MKGWPVPGAAGIFSKGKSEHLMTTDILLHLQTLWKIRTGYKYLMNENWKESSGYSSLSCMKACTKMAEAGSGSKSRRAAVAAGSEQRRWLCFCCAMFCPISFL